MQVIKWCPLISSEGRIKITESRKDFLLSRSSDLHGEELFFVSWFIMDFLVHVIVAYTNVFLMSWINPWLWWSGALYWHIFVAI